MTKNYNYTNVTEEVVKKATGTTIAMWDMYSKSDRISFVKQLINAPDKVKVYKDWKNDLDGQYEKNEDRTQGFCNQISDTILEILFDEFDTIFTILNEIKTHNKEQLDKEILNTFLNLPEKTRNIINFGYLLSASVKSFLLDGALIIDNLGNDGADLFDMAVGKILIHHRLLTGESNDIDGCIFNKDGASGI
jgi:hypothetical protein